MSCTCMCVLFEPKTTRLMARTDERAVGFRQDDGVAEPRGRQCRIEVRLRFHTHDGVEAVQRRKVCEQFKSTTCAHWPEGRARQPRAHQRE